MLRENQHRDSASDSPRNARARRIRPGGRRASSRIGTSPKHLAFSFLELVIVVMIIGIIGAIATPRFAGVLQEATLQTRAGMIATHLDHARQTAITTGRSTTVSFVSLDLTYSSNEVDFPDLPGTRLNVDLAEQVHPHVQMIADFDGYSVLSFAPDGVPFHPGGALQSGFVSLGVGSHVERIDVAATTGAVRVLGDSRGAQP